jgi:hypothetical protein
MLADSAGALAAEVSAGQMGDSATRVFSEGMSLELHIGVMMGILSRTDILNTLIRRYRYRTYLEIGVGRRRNFQSIIAPIKHGVDSVRNATFKMSSDEFFNCNTNTYDLIFIDGLHEYEQVTRDIENSLRVLNPGGTVVVHDCNPTSEVFQIIPRVSKYWTGDVWKAIARLRMTRVDLSVVVVDTDWGCGIIRRGTQVLFPTIEDLSYDVLSRNREKLLNLIKEDNWLSVVV